MSRNFTDRFLRSLKPAHTRYIETDGATRGLQVVVHPSGRKVLRFRFKQDGQTHFVTFGDFPRPVSLGEARDRVTKLRPDLKGEAKASDPYWMAELRRAAMAGEAVPAEAAADEPDAITVRTLAEEWRDRYLRKHRESWEEVWRMLEKDVLPAWGERPADSIAPRDVVMMLDAIVDRGAPIAANRTHTVVAQLFSFGVSRGILETSPCTTIGKPTKKEKSRDRVLADDEIRAFWVKLDEARALDYMRTLLRLLLVLGCRRGELALAAWDEFDLEAGVWHIPAAHTKTGKPHDVPLSDLALALLRTLAEQTGGQPYLFPSPRGEKPIDPHAVSRAIRNNADLFELPHFTPHDLRRTVRTKLAELGVTPIVAKKVLGHTLSGMDRVYDRHAYTDEKREALQRWAEHLTAIVAGERPKVVGIHAA